MNKDKFMKLVERRCYIVKKVNSYTAFARAVKGGDSITLYARNNGTYWFMNNDDGCYRPLYSVDLQHFIFKLIVEGWTFVLPKQN